MDTVECIFFDLDDCLYQNSWATATKLNAKFGQYCQEKLGVSEERMQELFKTYGTTLCGLVRERLLDESQVEDFLAEVHDISLCDDIKPDPKLRSILQALPHRRWVFTASTPRHATRCLELLGIHDLFEGVVACSSAEVLRRAGYVSKHDARCFKAAMDIAGVPHCRSAGCVLLDDSPSNLKTAKAVGWRAVQVGLQRRDGSPAECPEADLVLGSLHELPSAWPDLFAPPPAEDKRSAKVAQTEEATAPPRKQRRLEPKPLLSSPRCHRVRAATSPLRQRVLAGERA